jgi:hypothetical protein
MGNSVHKTQHTIVLHTPSLDDYYCYITEGSELESRQSQEFSLLHVVQTDPAVHPASYPMGTWGFFPRG